MSQRDFERAARRRDEASRRRQARSRRRAGIAAGAVGATVLFAPTAASAATFQVDKTGDGVPNAGACTAAADDCTLREAITEANALAGDDEITFANTVAGTITLTQGQLSVGSAGALTITGPGASALTVTGNGQSRVFNLGAGGPVDISGLTLTGGDGSPDAGNADVAGSGGAIVTAAQLDLTDSVVTGNKAVNGGGLASTSSSAKLVLVDTKVTGNEATGSGGGIWSQADLSLTGSVVSGNTAVAGGGGVDMRSTFVGEGEGEGKYAITTEDTTVSGNKAANGAGLQIDGFSTKYTGIEQTTVSGNTATGPGGGIDFVNGLRLANIENSTLAGNQGTVGGGIHANYQIAARAAAPQDRADFNDPGLDVQNTTVASNTATSTGGGIGLENDGGLQGDVGLISTIVADNSAGSADKDLSDNTSGFSSQHSLVETPGSATLNTDAAAPTITGQDPKLGALADNGGPTQTKLPAATSPAIDKGDNPNTLTEEQRHTARTINLATANATNGDGTDIGAVEISSLPKPQTPPSNPGRPSVPVTPSATPTVCGRRAISLVRADVKGKKVRLTGLVGSKLYGKKVTIQTDPKGAKNSAFTKTTTVTASAKNGSFTATVPKPDEDDFVSIRYRARSGSAVSPSLKLPQSLTSRSVKSAKGTITVKGRVKKSVLGKRNRVKIRRLVCGRYRTVGTAKPDEDGNYTVTFKSTQLRGVAFYRAESKVLRKPGSKVYVIQYARAIAIRTTGQTG